MYVYLYILVILNRYRISPFPGELPPLIPGAPSPNPPLWGADATQTRRNINIKYRPKANYVRTPIPGCMAGWAPVGRTATANYPG